MNKVELPGHMRAHVVEDLVGPAGMRLRELPLPTGHHPYTEGDRLLVEVHTAGIAYPDVLMSQGRLQIATKPPYVPGAEICGRVVEAPVSSRFKIGDRVASSVLVGGLAEYALARPEYTVVLPKTMSDQEGAALIINYGTAWLALDRAGFASGERVLVLGAAGGVGTAALDLIRALGGEAIAVVSTEEKAEIAAKFGAAHVLMTQDDWLSEVRTVTGGKGVDLVLDPVGGDRFVDHLRALKIGGRLVTIGFAGGSIPKVGLNRLLLRNLSVIGFDFDVWDDAVPGIVANSLEQVRLLAEAGRISPHVGNCFAFEDAPDALRCLEERRAIGKAVVDVRPPNTRIPLGQ